MKIKTLALAAIFALTSTFALAHSHHHGKHHRMHHSAATGGANGTAAGPTSLSGTGTSKDGGQKPGAPDK